MHHPAFIIYRPLLYSSGLFCLALAHVARDARARDGAAEQFISANDISQRRFIELNQRWRSAQSD